MVLIIPLQIVSLLMAFAALPAVLPANCPAYDGDVSAKSCVVMYEDGSCLYEKNADDRMLIASTTKIMTAIVSIENASPDDPVLIRESHCLVEGSSMDLKPGETYTVKQLLQGLLLSSGNDAALALADTAGGSQRAFVELMNRRAAELGLKHTHFSNPHGLDAKDHYSTARDLARLMLYCMKNPVFREIAGTQYAEVNGRVLPNHNRLLTLYPGCIGGKTGYTMAAGRCLVTCCERDGMLLACVTLSAPDDWNDHMRLYDWAFQTFRVICPESLGTFEVPVISGSKAFVTAAPEGTIRFLLPRSAKLEIRASLPPFVFAPVTEGEAAGSLKLLVDGSAAAEYPLSYRESAQLAYPCMGPFFRKELVL